MRWIVLIGLGFGLAARGAQPQAGQTLLDAGYNQMYDLRFTEAHRSFAEYARAYPDDAMGPASDAAAWLFGELDRLHILQSEFFLHDENFRKERHLVPDPAVAREFQRQIAVAGSLAGAKLANSPRDRNALLASMLVLGLQSDYNGLIAERYLSSLSAMRKGRQMAERILKLDPDCADAWVAIGVENYLLSLKSLPARWVFSLLGNSSDREYGLAKLRLTAEHGHYLRPFAQLLLAVAELRANHPERSRALLTGLAAAYPHNQLYAEELAKLPSGQPHSGQIRGQR